MKEKHSCAICKNSLMGTSSKGAKSEKRVLRPLPNLCVRCYERVFRLAKRLEQGEIRETDVELRYLHYVNIMRGKN